jgi:hypothetical protein
MLLLRYWLQHTADAFSHYFMVLAEADTPESWGECPIPVEQKLPVTGKIRRN